MVKAGDEMVNEVTGLRTVFCKTAADTGGELLQVDWIGEPGWTAGPKPVHRKQLERFTVVSGTLGVHVAAQGARDYREALQLLAVDVLWPGRPARVADPVDLQKLAAGIRGGLAKDRR